MAEKSNITAKDPSLKRYFRYMLTNRKISVQFTSNRIKEIIETDIGIKFESYDCLYARVCTEAFAYYMQSWPEWRSAVKSTYSDELYEKLKAYLKSKLLFLKAKEVQMYDKNHVIHLRSNMDGGASFTPGNREKLPFALKINVPFNILSTQEISFRKNGDDLLFEFSDPKSPSMDLGLKDVFSHPFVAIEFKIPGLLHLKRSTPFKLERFIQHPEDKSFRTTNYIGPVENGSPNIKVYSHGLFEEFFHQLNTVLTDYSHKIPDLRRSEILFLSEMFLADINDTGLCNKTLCEGSAVSYNIGKSQYYTDVPITGDANDKTDTLVLRKVLTPVVRYSLIFCSILQEDVTENGFKYFYFVNEEDKVFESVFIHYINSCIKYQCILCETTYTLDQLKIHLNTVHRLDAELNCCKCNRNNSVLGLLYNKWSHGCEYL